jgi:hypothetical protein
VDTGSSPVLITKNKEMKITKHNVREIIENYLKSKKIKYSIDDEDNFGLVYEIYVGSLECYLQVEYDLEKIEDDYVVVQLFTEIDDLGNSLYSVTWENDEHHDSIESEIDTLIDETKQLNRAVIKIGKKIEDIIEICEEHGLSSEDFIQINYDFNK